MKYETNLTGTKQQTNLLVALRIVDPDAVLTDQDPDLMLFFHIGPEFYVRLDLSGTWSGTWEIRDRDALDPRFNKEDHEQRLKELIRLGAITLLGRFLDKKPPWGILSSVRPGNIYHYFRNKGYTTPEIRKNLLSIYSLSPDKADLLIDIESRQEKYLAPARAPYRPVGIYIGIPFCPSRCRYCSFPAVSLETHRHIVPQFLTALQKEITAVGRFCHTHGLTPETIYIGGGTPTSFDEPTFDRILSKISKEFYSPGTVEFTVEAGRPETISETKLRSMMAANVSRISVNPQTMHAATLEVIGRNHTIDDVRRAVTLVRRFPDLDLNMDLILGLPGETGDAFLESLQAVLPLVPENLTLHTLAPKRAALWRKEFSRLTVSSDQELTRASEIAGAYLREKGYQPYYLYRQRYILADLENTGYAFPGKECIYNIQMMEKGHTILGLGAGAVTKWVMGEEVIRDQNPGCPATYAGRIAEKLEQKLLLTRKYLHLTD